MHTCTECYDTHPEDKLLNGKCPTCGSDVIKDATFDDHGLPMSRNNTNTNVQEDTMNITDGYTNGSYREVASWAHSGEVIIPFTGMLSAYLFAAINAGISAPYYYADTDIESLFYATGERNEFRIHNWLRANGGIDGWIMDGSTHFQINPTFDVEDQLHDMLEHMRHLYSPWELRFIGYRFNTAFKGHDFMVCQGDWSTERNSKGVYYAQCPSCDGLYNDYMETLYDEEMMRRAENEPFPENEFVVHPTNVGWVMSAQEKAILDYGDEYMVNDWDGPPMFHYMPEPGPWSEYAPYNSAYNWLSTNLGPLKEDRLLMPSVGNPIVDEEGNPVHLFEDGPVEGVDSHAYYGPMTTLTNFEEAQRDREFD